jgi:hypothetical protein
MNGSDLQLGFPDLFELKNFVVPRELPDWFFGVKRSAAVFTLGPSA